MKKNILIHGVPDKDYYQQLKARKDIKSVYVTEFRPLLYGANLVAKELLKVKIKPVIICDNMVGFCLEKKMIDEIHIFAKKENDKGLLCFIGSMIYAICAIQNKAKVYVYKAGKIKKDFSNNDVLKLAGVKTTVGAVKGYCPTWEVVPADLAYKVSEL